MEKLNPDNNYFYGNFLMSFFHFLKAYYPSIFVWLAAIAAIISFRRSWILPNKVLAVFIVIYAFADTAATIMGSYYGINNHFLYNILYGSQFLVVAYFYYAYIKIRLIRKAILFFMIAFPLFVLANTFWIQGFLTFQSYSFVIGGSFLLLLSVSYLWQLYYSTETHSIFKDPIFWFSLAWLFYDGLTVPYLGMLNYLLENYYNLASKYYLLVIDISDCLRSLLITIVFICLKIEKK